MKYLVEEESGTYSGSSHQHDGYYAGDFSHRPVRPVDCQSSGLLMGAAA
jgi:hypothetical protein